MEELRELLRLAGFTTTEVRGSAGERLGFDIVTVEGRKGVLARTGVRSSVRVGHYGVMEGFEHLALPESARREIDLIVIDEIEKMDFRADILLVLGGLAVVFALFIAPTVLRVQLGRAAKGALLTLAGVLVTYGIILTVVPAVWTPFAAKFTMPKVGWFGVFAVAIVFDLTAAVLAFFVLRRMKVPTAGVVPTLAPQPHEA